MGVFWTTEASEGFKFLEPSMPRVKPGQQLLLLGAYSALSRQISKGKVEMFTRHEMMDVVMVDGKCRGIIARNSITGELESATLRMLSCWRLVGMAMSSF
jgi:hypothetical protein